MDRYVVEVRATRAYMAGFGTAGSLLAGAALLFVIAGAAVSFHGWPQVGPAPSPASVLVNGPNRGASSAVSPRLLVAAARAAAVAPPGGSRAAGGLASATRPAGSAVRLGGQLPSPPGVPARIPSANRGQPPATCGHCGAGTGGNAGSTGGGPGSGGGDGGGGGGRGGLAGVVPSTTKTLAGTVTSTGSALGATVGGVAGTVGGISSSLAGTVATTGQAVGNTVTGTTGALGGALSGAGQALGGLLGPPQH